MRALGYLFAILLILAVVGYIRGWFSVTTAEAGGKHRVTVGVNDDKISADAKAATVPLASHSAGAVEALNSTARKLGTAASEVQGTLTAVDATTRELTLTTGTQTLDFQVPDGVVILRDGEPLGFADLQPAMRVVLTFGQAGETKRLARITIVR